MGLALLFFFFFPASLLWFCAARVSGALELGYCELEVAQGDQVGYLQRGLWLECNRRPCGGPTAGCFLDWEGGVAALKKAPHLHHQPHPFLTILAPLNSPSLNKRLKKKKKKQLAKQGIIQLNETNGSMNCSRKE